MPRGNIDLIEIDDEVLSYCDNISHIVMIIPDTLQVTDPHYWNIVIENSDGIFVCDSVDSTNIKANPLLGIHFANELDNALLRKQWNIALHTIEKTENAIDYIPILIDSDHLDCIPLLFLARQFKEENTILQDTFQSNINEIRRLCVKYMSYLVIKQRSIASLEREYILSHPDDTLNEANQMYHFVHNNIDYRMKRFSISLHVVDAVITFPGISKKLRNLLSISKNIPMIEAKATRLMGLHRAIAQNAVYFEIRSSSDTLYKILDILEQQLKLPPGTNNPYVWRSLREIGKELLNLLGEEQIRILNRTRHICAFTEYPLGLAILPNQEVPLIVTHNVINIPIIPLSRQLPIELSNSNLILLNKQCRILFIECVQMIHKMRLYTGFLSNLQPILI